MRKTIAVLAAVAAVAALLPSAAIAGEEAAAFAPVKQFIDGFNKGDVKTALAACAAQAVILDEFPPYLWQGTNACGTWAEAFDADAKANGITDGKVTLAKPRHVYVTGDKAYVVVPATYDYKLKGKKVSQKGAVMVATLQKGADGWRITAWSWATGKNG